MERFPSSLILWVNTDQSRKQHAVLLLIKHTIIKTQTRK